MSASSEIFGQISQAGLLAPNEWKERQQDFLDSRTDFIYRCDSSSELLDFFDKNGSSKRERSYAIHRWRNYKRHEAWLQALVEEVPGIEISQDSKHKSRDFRLVVDGVAHWFDLKVTRFPRALETDVPDGALASWFYKNQSSQRRFHEANRFFIVGNPEEALYSIELARVTLRKFSENMAGHRHFVRHRDGHVSRAVLLRQEY